MDNKTRREYTVQVNDVPLVYPTGYFPRKFRYKNEAITCATEAISFGATLSRVECPNGSELDFRPTWLQVSREKLLEEFIKQNSDDLTKLAEFYDKKGTLRGISEFQNGYLLVFDHALIQVDRSANVVMEYAITDIEAPSSNPGN